MKNKKQKKVEKTPAPAPVPVPVPAPLPVPPLALWLREAAEQEAEGGFDVLGGQLKRLADLVEVWSKEAPGAFGVPEWSNWEKSLDDPEAEGFWNLGDVAQCYSSWIEEEGVEHDGACQLGELAVAMQGTLNALDVLFQEPEGIKPGEQPPRARSGRKAGKGKGGAK